MQVTVTGQQIEITDPLRDYTTEKLGRIKRHFDHVITTAVILRVEKMRHLAEASVQTKGATLHAEAKGADMYAAIDLLVDKLDRQVLRHKEKVLDHRA